jgi:hypothetical protein
MPVNVWGAYANLFRSVAEAMLTTGQTASADMFPQAVK